MKNSIIYTLLFLLLFWACKKGIKEDNLFIRGRLFLNDNTFQQNKPIPLANRKVTLHYENDTLNYLYSDSTDKEGYFSFIILTDDKNNKFLIRFEDTLKGNYYVASERATVGQNDLILTATLSNTMQNGYSLTFMDKNGGSISYAKARLYKSLALATIDDPAGAVDSFVSDGYGRYTKLNVQPGTYYLNAFKKVDTVLYQRSLKQIEIASTGIFSDSVQLNPKQTIYQNGMKITVTDSLGGLIPNATVLLFNSQLLALSNDIAGAILKTTSDSVGIFTRMNLPAGAYYVNATIKVDTITYQRLVKPVMLPLSGIITDTMVVRKKQAQ